MNVWVYLTYIFYHQEWSDYKTIQITAPVAESVNLINITGLTQAILTALTKYSLRSSLWILD